MDIISHWLRWWISVGRKSKKQFWLSFAFGILPDFLSFGLPFVITIFSVIFLWASFTGMEAAHHNLDGSYIHNIYTVTHSFIVWAVFFFWLWLIFRKPILPVFAWLFHILLDIPTHSLKFYATPFLWPISDYKFDGTPRSNPWILWTDIVLIIIMYGIYYWRKYWKKRKILSK